MKKKYKSEALEALNETVSGLHKIGLVTEAEMRWYDDGCFVQPAVSRVSSPKAAVACSGATVYVQGK
ncbi:MAG: hypothetical protein LBG79_03075 [Spirochaetaceae bacterium]|jgi:DNA-binding transcriptional regulator YiaG|nr:hypothetical protein [Spirochaetaceae bacterium]GMO17970.1 MAG: hypothetical protein Pg6A_04630 [Termitinemataceae bacterium]